MSEAMNSNIRMRTNFDVDLLEVTPSHKLRTSLIDNNREYIHPLLIGYTRAIDSMVEYINTSNISKSIKNKVMLVLTSLILNEEDIIHLRDSKLTDETGPAIPTMTDIQFINDIPLELDIVQAVYTYILRIAKEAGFYSVNGVFGNIDISGVMFNNIKTLNEVYKSYIVGVDGEVEDTPSKKLIQKITDLCRANEIIRERLMKLANKGKKPTKKQELYIRRHYKYNPNTFNMEKREKPLSPIVFSLLANKNESVYNELKKK